MSSQGPSLLDKFQEGLYKAIYSIIIGIVEDVVIGIAVELMIDYIRQYTTYAYLYIILLITLIGIVTYNQIFDIIDILKMNPSAYFFGLFVGVLILYYTGLAELWIIILYLISIVLNLYKFYLKSKKK
ncbi:MAG: hypothetical protein ACTSRZ_15890 [Promethearchaeota archaeon]